MLGAGARKPLGGGNRPSPYFVPNAAPPVVKISVLAGVQVSSKFRGMLSKAHRSMFQGFCPMIGMCAKLLLRTYE